MSSVLKAKESRLRYLQRLYELSEGNIYERVPIDQIDSDLGISDEEDTKIVTYLSDKGLAGYSSFGHVSITTRGIDEVEKIMAQTYAEKEFRVLKTIHETKHKEFNGWVNIWDLEKELSDIPRNELFMILEDLENRKGLIGSIDQAVWIIPPGIEELEQAQKHPERSTPNFPAQIINNYTLNVGGDNKANIQQGGHGNTQSIAVTNTNNPDFDKAITALAELVQTSGISVENKDELLGELQSINKLALKEPDPALVERAKSKINYFELTANGVALGAKIAPYIPQLINYFETLIK